MTYARIKVMFLKVHQVVFESFSRHLADTSESDTKNMYI